MYSGMSHSGYSISTYGNSYNLNTYHMPVYTKNTISARSIETPKPKTPEEHITVFLNKDRPDTPMINTLPEVNSFINQAFEKTTGYTLPQDILIQILPHDEFKNMHEYMTCSWDEGIAGFSINGNKREVYIKQDNLDKVMIVAGHEIGHVITASLSNKYDEEAKAFAFEFAWIKAIHENNIANLAFNLNPHPPALNGLHNISHSFVSRLINFGESAFNIYQELVHGFRSINIEQLLGGE